MVAGSGEVPVAHPAEFKAICKRITDEYKSDPIPAGFKADAGGWPVTVGGRADRRRLAPSFGARPGDPRDADVVIEAAGTAEAWRDALELVRPGGTVLFFGGLEPGTELAVDTYRLHYEELTLRGAFHHAPRHVRAALAFLGSRAYPWERLITHEVSLEQLPALFADPPADYLKAAVRLDR